ncbi:hypothetical protein BMS3Abin09_00154 [bacterium BMS3Abin09]|nr:hypothetical protein BMS3Abin09_00154 [bacterium BMS3Abin09]GBE41823.1 hypothetical protein BMS3Bbin09_01731 [bacterium BMS3Bbin09]HDH34947.1 hypothetical protein [Nitrospirota bacterium]HDO66669.1 hypothetical protein [Nitrospirota bacterium]HEW80843.1 hypothetical protein [Nitrospirota bacterium]
MTANRRCNCWEIKKCGREPGGINASEHGECPASIEKKLNGVHGGENAGRACWVIAGSLCGDNVQGNYVDKYENCTICDFYMKVKSEESANFTLMSSLIMKLEQ